ncbi:cytochrome P450 [Xylariaceae sp. AK1471]|nr:cytochrome P450 [Xylariaceae sp. AK1471]
MNFSLPHINAASWLWLLLAPTLYLVFTHVAGSRHRHSTPLAAFPVVGHRNEWFYGVRAKTKSLWKMAEWASEGYAKFTKHNTPYLITTLDRGQVILLPHKQMKTLYRLPEDRLDVFGTLQQQIQAQYTVGDQRVIHDPYHRYLIPSQLTRELDQLTRPMVAEIEDGFKATWGTETEWREVPVWKACFHVIARATNSALYGAPLCRNKEYLESLDGQSTAFFGGSMLISITPEILRPMIGFCVRSWCQYYSRRIARICAPYIEKRIRETREGLAGKGSNQSVTDGLQLIIDEAISRDDITQLSTRLIADRMVITNDVSLHGITFTMQHLILCLVSSDPSLGYIEALRGECANALDQCGGIWSLETVRNLKLMDSAIRESMRVTPFSSVAMARTVVDPRGITVEHGSSTVLLPRGTMLAIPIESIHYDDDIYPEAHQFNLFRFMSPQNEGGGPGSTGNGTSKPATTADDQFFGFGTSKNPCPGRFLAVHQIKLILAHILLNYDLEYTKEKPQLTSVLAMKVPKLDVTLRVRKRAG